MGEGTGRRRWPAALTVTAGLHLAGAAALAVAPARWPWIGGVLLLDHLVIAAASMTPRGRLLGPNLRRLPAAATADGRVAVTFDDGPDPEVTPRVLELLDAHGARATFFVIGARAAAHPELVAEIARRGHRVENHSFRHANTFALRGPRAEGADVDRAQAVLERTSGRRPRYFRAPAGMRNPWLGGVLARRGLHLVSWTRRGYDAVDSAPRRVCRRLLRGLAAGDILVLHDGNAARDRNRRPVVLEALPRVLEAIAGAGLRATPLPAP